jgi:thioesterase domain-containing protein
VGSVLRYRAFYERARRSVAGYEATALGIPVVLVHPEGSSAAHDWDDHPRLSKVCVGGGHNSMLQQPHVAEVASAVLAARALL